MGEQQLEKSSGITSSFLYSLFFFTLDQACPRTSSSLLDEPDACARMRCKHVQVVER